jgi:hypothetical protein
VTRLAREEPKEADGTLDSRLGLLAGFTDGSRARVGVVLMLMMMMMMMSMLLCTCIVGVVTAGVPRRWRSCYFGAHRPSVRIQKLVLVRVWRRDEQPV